MSRETVKSDDPKRRERNKRYRAALKDRGIKAFQVVAPETARDLFRQAADLMTRTENPIEPRQAMRQVGGANEPGQDEMAADMTAELDAARQRRMLEAERDAARAAEATEREKGQAVAQAAQERTTEALQRAKKAEDAIRQAKSLPGLKGRLVRWLTGDLLK